MSITELIKKEGWEIKDGKIHAEGHIFPITHVLNIHLKLYSTETNPESRYRHLKAAHDYLWPDTVWHYWTERRFREHCNGWSTVSWAGGASTAKSYDAAKLAILFWLGNPKERAVIVASTTLESMKGRVWGYITSLLNEAAIEIPLHYLKSSPPKIYFNKKDTLHGIFAVAAKKGDDSTAISNWIGRHPKQGMMLILDEGTDMPSALLTAIPNLESNLKIFQCLIIGNSLSKFDLHGILSTPKFGWKSVDPMKDIKWPTTQNNGVCLFFGCYESPEVHERDPVKKAKLSFLITAKKIEEKKKLYGADSDSFWRFVLGFWRSSSTDDVVISREFINEFGVLGKAEWSGLRELHMLAGLDPAFSTGGDQCVLRLAVLGLTVEGDIVLDFRGEKLLFRIPIVATSEKSAELQIADQVIEIMNNHNCPMQNLTIDANGQGRALGEVLRLRSKSLRAPWKVYSTSLGNKRVNSFDVQVRTNHELWFAFRDYIQHRQIRGLDDITVLQLTSRLVEINEKTHKQQLELKSKYKSRMGGILPSLARSPDEADAASLCLQSAILNYGFKPGEKHEVTVVRGEQNIKYWTFMEEIKMLQQEHENEPLQATFLGNLEDLKTGVL